MKIAVLTWFRDSNYGTILQALALQVYLAGEGHDPYLVNYLRDETKTRKRELNLIERAVRKYNYLLQKNFEAKNSKGFEEKKSAAFHTIDSRCKVTKTISSEQDFSELNNIFDTFICGSDQIWNPNWIDGRFYLDFVKKGKNKISYAASLGVSHLSKEDEETIGGYLSSFSKVSLREKTHVSTLQKFSKNTVAAVCDPTLLISKDYWSTIANTSEVDTSSEYVFFYFLSYQYEHWIAAKKLARKHHLKLVGIPVFGKQFFLRGCEKYPFASPETFLKLIKNARYVVTDSFHATAFSIIMGKEFFYFRRFADNSSYSQNSRVEDLAFLAGLDDRLLKHKSKRIIESGTIDYLSVYERLRPYINASGRFLKEAIAEGDAHE